MHLAKDAGLKIGVHMMPGLPGSDPDRDMESFRVLFEDPAYRPDLQPGVLREVHRLPGLRVRVAPVDPFQHVLVGRLNPQLHAGRTQVQGFGHLDAQEAVRLRLDREANASARGRFVGGLRGREVRSLESVKPVEAPFHEPLPIARFEGGEGSAEDDQIHLVRIMSDPLQRLDSGRGLPPWIVMMIRGPPGSGFRAQVGLRCPEPRSTRAICADTVRTSMGGGHHGDHRNAARRPCRLDTQEVLHSLPVGTGHPLEDRRIRWKASETMRACEAQLDPLELVLRGGPSIPELYGQGLDKFRVETAHEGQPGSSDRTGASGTAACARPNRSTARASPTPRDASPAKTRAVPAMIPASRAGEWESSLTGLTKKPIQSKNRAI